MSSFEIVAAGDLDPARLHDAFTAAFADYLIGPFELAPAQWPQFLARQGVELAESRVALQRGEPIAFCLAAPRPEVRSWRLGTMGALPAARGSGAAPALLDDFVARAQAAGVRSVELECFAQNTRALRLYEGRGFRQVDALHGWRHAGGFATESTDKPVQVELPDAFDWLDACATAGIPLPLQVTPHSLRALPLALQAWRRGEAQLVFSEGADARIQVHSLVDRVPAQQDARALVAALLARYARQALHVPQLQRQAVGGAALESLGFERLPLHQLWLRRPLA
jgi:ribosomal protein S18 acetylase RimI-like enzyme